MERKRSITLDGKMESKEKEFKVRKFIDELELHPPAFEAAPSVMEQWKKMKIIDAGLVVQCWEKVDPSVKFEVDKVKISEKSQPNEDEHYRGMFN